MPFTRVKAYLRVYEQARTAHLERLAGQEDRLDFVYRRISYDFDHRLAERLGARRLNRRRTFQHLFGQQYSFVELNEPLFMAAWPSLLLYLSAIRLGDLLNRRRTIITCYAIENIDPVRQFRAYSRLPSCISRLIVTSFVATLLSQYDRIAFGTDASRDRYAALAPKALGRAETRTFHALPQTCPHCVPEKHPGQAVFIGAFEFRKGIDRIFSAWPKVRGRHSAASLVVAGKGSLTEFVKASSAVLDAALLIDPSRDEIHKLLSSGSVLILLSRGDAKWKEQVGLPIVEGLAHGCTIVTSSDTGLGPWLQRHGHFVVDDCDDDDAVAEAIVSALSKPIAPSLILRSLPSVDAREEAGQWLTQAYVER